MILCTVIIPVYQDSHSWSSFPYHPHGHLMTSHPRFLALPSNCFLWTWLNKVTIATSPNAWWVVCTSTSTSSDINCPLEKCGNMCKSMEKSTYLSPDINCFKKSTVPKLDPSSPHVAAWWECCASSHPHARAAESSRPDLGLPLPTDAANPLVRHLSSHTSKRCICWTIPNIRAWKLHGIWNHIYKTL